MTDEITLDDIRDCEETVAVNKKALEKLKESGQIRKRGYAPERMAVREVLGAVE